MFYRFQLINQPYISSGNKRLLQEANWNVPLTEFAFSRPGLTINWGLQNNIRAKVTKMSVTGRKIDYNGVGALRG